MQGPPPPPANPVDVPSLLPPFAPRDATERWLFELHRRGIHPGLDGVRQLLAAYGNPERDLASVVVGGTNGKGTMAICLAALCRSAGLSTALYTSPHLLRPHERLVIDDQPITSNQLRTLVANGRPAIDRLQTTFFESLTALALTWFQQRKVDVAILEAGLGGRWDATNAVPKRGVVLTSVGLDHQELLGDTLEQIAGEKLGLAEAYRPFYLSDLPANIHRLAHEELDRAQAIAVDLADLAPTGREVDGWNALVQMGGVVQRKQLAEAVAVYRDLARRNHWPDADPDRAFAGLRSPARYERYGATPELIVDTAHNAHALESLLSKWGTTGSRERRILVLGSMRDKPLGRTLELAVAHAGTVLLTAPRWYRALPPRELAEELQALAKAHPTPPRIEVHESVREALEAARARAHEVAGCVLVTGSNFLVAEALDRLGVDDLAQEPGSVLWDRNRPLRSPDRAREEAS